MLLLEQPPNLPKTERVAPSSILVRVRDFLPQIAAANEQLVATATDVSDHDMMTIEKVVAPPAASSSSDSSDDSSDDSTSDEDESEVVEGSRKIAMDIVLFENDEDDSEEDADEDLPTGWRTENDKRKSISTTSSLKKRKIEEL